MKRIISKAVCLLCAGALALTAAGCSKSAASSSTSASSEASVYGSASDYDYQNFAYSDGLDENGYWSGIRALDYVTLPEDYASISLKKADIEPTEEDVQSQIDSLLSQNTTTQQITDRAAADGDTVNIDYVGTVDGVAFTGGTYSGYSLTLGSGSFIDGFEDQIVGHKPGETFDVNVTFPDGYSDSTDAEGNAVMVDVSGKPVTSREATAHGIITMNEDAFAAVQNGTVKKGDVLGVARVAGIMATKRTSELIPLCHPLPLSKLTVDFHLLPEQQAVEAVCTARTIGVTGVEMEALTGVSAALLTIYDMCKAVDKGMELGEIHLVEKTGGKSGHYIRAEGGYV